MICDLGVTVTRHGVAQFLRGDGRHRMGIAWASHGKRKRAHTL